MSGYTYIYACTYINNIMYITYTKSSLSIVLCIAFGKVFRLDPLLQMNVGDQKALLECLEELTMDIDEEELKDYCTRRMNYDRIRVDDQGNVIRLDLSHSGLIGKIPRKFGHFKHLLELNLAGNHLHGMLPSSLGNLHYLQILNLGSSEGLNGYLPAGIPQDCVKTLPKSYT